MVKVFLSPSEQFNNAYAWGNTTEGVQCGKIANACKTALERCGISVKLQHEGTMASKCQASDAFGADLHVCIHTNACNGNVSGTRMFCHDATGNGMKACKAIFNVLAPLTPGKSENISVNPQLYEIRVPNAPTAYIECEFHDVPSVAKWIVEHTTDIGEAIAHGICNYFGIAYKTKSEPAPAPKPTPTPAPSKDELYRVRKSWADVASQIGAYRVLNNAIKVCKAGYSVFDSKGNVVYPKAAPAKKSIAMIAQEVIEGKWGNGQDRKNRLTAAGYNYDEVQNYVNKLLSAPAKKSIDEVAREVIAGKWGNGADRKNRLIAAGYDYDVVQKRVNEILR